MASLNEFISHHRQEGFRPEPYYSRNGDCLTFYFRDEQSYGDRVDSLLTLYRSIETEEIVGCQIKGVKCILDRLHKFGVRIEDEKVDLRILFLGYEVSAAESQRETVEQLRQAAEDAGAQLDKDELVPA